VYFVHSYYAELSEHTVAQTEYIIPYSAAMQKDNFFAVQFHPEKSGKVGEQILRNFIKL
ncbi:MAG TPA: imidazole glycerol phosphate synthase subunit HisH, partial [Candidatus Marinimicrobia bacterium]|nr:imidazole glycerol phosphate synthase subunit HisH [Candidatus Neomarinimicrobiota bacterium]